MSGGCEMGRRGRRRGGGGGKGTWFVVGHVAGVSDDGGEGRGEGERGEFHIFFLGPRIR